MGGTFIGGGRPVILGIYSDNSGEPQTLLAKTDSFTVVDRTNIQPLNQTLFIASGTTCWLGVLSDSSSGTVAVAATQQPGALKSYENPPSFDMPETFVVDNTNPRRVHLFIDGCESSPVMEVPTEASNMDQSTGIFVTAIAMAAIAIAIVLLAMFV